METLQITDTIYQRNEESTTSSIFNFKQQCNVLKDKFIRMYPVLDIDDLNCGNGNKEPMMDRLQRKLGLSQDELYRIIVNLQ